MRTKRTVAACLAICLVCAACFAFAACDKNEKNDKAIIYVTALFGAVFTIPKRARRFGSLSKPRWTQSRL